MTSKTSNRVFVFFESKPRTRYPTKRDAGNNPGMSLRMMRNFPRTASME